MRILWIVNMVLPDVASALKMKTSASGGWLVDYANKLVNTPGIELATMTYANVGNDIDTIACGMRNFIFAGGGKRLLFDHPQTAKDCQKVLNEFRPDVIHIHGTEYAIGAAMVKLKPEIPILLTIQGILKRISEEYYGGLPFVERLKIKTWNSVLKLKTPFFAKRLMTINAKREKYVLENVKHVTGRTEWDMATMLSINDELIYHRFNYNLRAQFYDSEKWDIQQIDRHTVYTGSATYTLKGLHILLRAIAIVKKHYPDGICTMLILLSHTFAKVSASDAFDNAYTPLRTFLGQFVVVPFLFYSGYGIMTSLSTKKGYLRSFPKKRLLKLAIRFSVITLVYILLHLALGNRYSFQHILLSFTGLTTIGSGNWYIFSTFAFYIFVIVCFNIFKSKYLLAAIAVTILLMVLTVVEMLLGFPTYYYSTMIYLGVGMLFSAGKETFDKIVMKNNIIWSAVLVSSALCFVLGKRFMDYSPICYPIWCGFGMLMILCLTMKIKIQNNFLSWLGRTAFFSISLQGIPQMLSTRAFDNNYLIYIFVIAFSFILIYIADALFTKIGL